MPQLKPATSDSPLALLGGRSSREFLRQFWQKQPLLVRQALKPFHCPIPADELAGLACEQDVESRLVRRAGPEGPWQLRHGPFQASDFAALPTTGWTLLVQDVDKHDPRLDSLLEAFRFIPDWRVDDVMVSYATASGSVGPHVDDYDVFLIQGNGRRRWQVAAGPVVGPELRGQEELRLLRHFEPRHDWVLEPGDLLYLPPGLPHHGTALDDDCMTLSVGLRAPLWRESLGSLVDQALERLQSDARYTDPDLEPTLSPGAIEPQVTERFRVAWRHLADQVEQQLPTWLGCYLTEAKPHLGSVAPARRPHHSTLEHLRRPGYRLARERASRFAYGWDVQGAVWLFVDGDALPVPEGAISFVEVLCNQRAIDSAQLRPLITDTVTQDLLLELLAGGHVSIEKD